VPTVRVGLIQPSIGIRPDDHTTLIRTNAADPRRPFIPPFYAEPGLELSYHPLSWIQGEAGIFGTQYLSDTVPNLNAPFAWLFRLMFLPQILPWGVHTYVGFSGYGSGDFFMANAFLGIGVKGVLTVMGELAETTFAVGQKTQAWSAVLGVTPKPWIHFEGRAERAFASVTSSRYSTSQYVFSVPFVPVPFLELRPEYRYLKTDAFALGQYTLQVYAYF
jgi:hypothetical protein